MKWYPVTIGVMGVLGFSVLVPRANGDNTILDAMCIVESQCDSSKVGDGGDSIGAYQIQYKYWYDAVEFDSSIGGTYEDCLDKEYSLTIIRAYWNRYATTKRLGHTPTDEDRARIHNGGPNGYKKQSTKKYWAKIQKELR